MLPQTLNYLDVLIKYFRTAIVRIRFNKFGKHSQVNGRVFYICPENITVGDHTSLNEAVIINGYDQVTIGDYCHISPGVQIHTGSLNLNQDYKKRRHLKRSVIIEDGVWIGSDSVISYGVKIGKGSVIGANSVVLKDIPENQFWAGNPAQKIKNLATSSGNK